MNEPLSNERSRECPLCSQECIETIRQHSDAHIIAFEICGTYEIQGVTAHTAANDLVDVRHILSGLARSYHERGAQLAITHDNVDQLVIESGAPLAITEKFDRLLTLIFQRQKFPGVYTEVRPYQDYPVVYGRDGEELEYLIEQVIAQRLVYRNITHSVRLTVDGWVRVEELLATRPDSNQAFVAMWFDPTIDFGNRTVTIRIQRDRHNFRRVAAPGSAHISSGIFPV